MPLFRGVVNLFNPFSWFASRADCKEDFVHREVEVQEEDLPEHWEIAPETCDEKLSCKDEVEHDDLENAVDGNTSLERTSDTAEFLDCSDGNDECSALEECCPSVGLVESVEGSSSKKEITCHLDASRSDDTQVDQLRSAIFAEDRSQELESLSVEEWNEQGTTNGSRIASDHMVSATELTPFVDSSMKKKGTVDVDKNLHKPNPAASTTEIPKTKKGKGITDRVVSERPSTREEPEILIVEPPFNVEAFGRKNIAFTSSAKKRKATGDRSFVEGENCVVYESPAPKQVKKLKQMRKSADMTAAKRSSSSEACSNRDYGAAAAPTPVNTPVVAHAPIPKLMKFEKRQMPPDLNSQLP